jgi:hypothetical protein
MGAPLLGTKDADGFVWTVPRQIFVRLYVATGDAKASARDAKLPKEDDPEALLQQDSVKEAVAALHEQVLRRVYETSDTVISRYSNIADSDITDFLAQTNTDPNGNVMPGSVKLKDWRVMPRHMRQRIKKLKFTTNAQGDTNFEIETHDPMKANDMLMRILRLDGDESGDSAKDFAEAIHAFMEEIDTLDEHYDDPDG